MTPMVSIVTPVLNEEKSLRDYREALEKTLLHTPGIRFEIILVDDGSTDSSWTIVEEFCDADSRFRGLRLSRNFGSHIALDAGIRHASGDAVATLAADLQDPPAAIIEFIEKWRAGAQIVWGCRRRRKDTAWRKLTSNFFFLLLRRYAMPRGSKFTTGSFFLIDRRVADCLRQFSERHRITFALVAWTGFEQDVVLYDRQRRTAGQSGWTFSRMLKAMYDAFIGFSAIPARLMTFTGVLTFSLALIFSLFLILRRWLAEPVPGWTALMVGLSVFFGLQFLMLGLVCEYLYRIYSEVTRRPLYFVSQEVGTVESSTKSDGSEPYLHIAHTKSTVKDLRLGSERPSAKEFTAPAPDTVAQRQKNPCAGERNDSNEEAYDQHDKCSMGDSEGGVEPRADRFTNS